MALRVRYLLFWETSKAWQTTSPANCTTYNNQPEIDWQVKCIIRALSHTNFTEPIPDTIEQLSQLFWFAISGPKPSSSIEKPHPCKASVCCFVHVIRSYITCLSNFVTKRSFKSSSHLFIIIFRASSLNTQETAQDWLLALPAFMWSLQDIFFSGITPTGTFNRHVKVVHLWVFIRDFPTYLEA